MPFVLRYDEGLPQETRSRVDHQGLIAVLERSHLCKIESVSALAMHGEGS